MEKVKVKLFLITCFVAFLLNLFYFIIFSPSLAKCVFAIKARNKYGSWLYTTRKFFGFEQTDNCWYFHQPISTLAKTNTNLYNYALSGRLVSINADRDIITLECSNGKKYNLYIKIEKAENNEWEVINVGANVKAE